MVTQEFAKLIGAELVLSMPYGAERSAILTVEGRKFCTFVFDETTTEYENLLEEFVTCVNAAVEYRLPFLASINRSYDGSSALWVNAQIALLNARETIPTALLVSEESTSAHIHALAAAFDLSVLLCSPAPNGEVASNHEVMETINVKCGSIPSASRVLHQWLKIVPSSKESVLVPEESLFQSLVSTASQATDSSNGDHPAFWSEKFVLQTFDQDSCVIFSNFEWHNIHAGMGLVCGIPTVFILPEIDRNEASITQADAHLILRLLRFSGRFGIPVIFSVDAGPTYGVGGARPAQELLITIADVLRMMCSPLLVIIRESTSPRSSLISHVAISRAEANLAPPRSEDFDALTWRREIAYRLTLGCRKFATGVRQ